MKIYPKAVLDVCEGQEQECAVHEPTERPKDHSDQTQDQFQTCAQMMQAMMRGDSDAMAMCPMANVFRLKAAAGKLKKALWVLVPAAALIIAAKKGLGKRRRRQHDEQVVAAAA